MIFLFIVFFKKKLPNTNRFFSDSSTSSSEGPSCFWLWLHFLVADLNFPSLDLLYLVIIAIIIIIMDETWKANLYEQKKTSTLNFNDNVHGYYVYWLEKFWKNVKFTSNIYKMMMVIFVKKKRKRVNRLKEKRSWLWFDYRIEVKWMNEHRDKHTWMRNMHLDNLC